jgi:hypothetical protein
MKKAVTFSVLLASLLVFGFSQKTPKPDKPPTPPSVKLEPGTVDFGDQVAKRHSKPQRIVVTNTGGQKLYINSVVIDGDHKKDFTLMGDTCTGATIGSGKSCVIDVIFTPAVNEKRKAMIVLTDNAPTPDSQQNVILIGNGINSADVPPGDDKQRR